MILQLCLGEYEDFIQLESLRRRLNVAEMTDDDLTAAFSVHATEKLSLDKLVVAWEDKKNLPLRLPADCVEYGIAAAFLKSQVTRQSAAEELGTSNSRFGFSVLRSKMGSTVSWPGSNALIVSSDGIENTLGTPYDHGLKEKVQPFPLLSFSAICLAAGVHRNEQKFKNAAALISQKPEALMRPRFLCRSVFDDTSTKVRLYDLIQSLDTVAAEDDEAYVRDASIRYAIFELFKGGATLMHERSKLLSFAMAVEETVTPEFGSSVQVEADCQVPLNGLYIRRGSQRIEYLWYGRNKAVTFEEQSDWWILSCRDLHMNEEGADTDEEGADTYFIEGDIKAA